MKAFKHISDNCLKRYKRFPFAFKRERERQSMRRRH